MQSFSNESIFHSTRFNEAKPHPMKIADEVELSLHTANPCPHLGICGGCKEIEGGSARKIERAKERLSDALAFPKGRIGGKAQVPVHFRRRAEFGYKDGRLYMHGAKDAQAEKEQDAQAGKEQGAQTPKMPPKAPKKAPNKTPYVYIDECYILDFNLFAITRALCDILPKKLRHKLFSIKALGASKPLGFQPLGKQVYASYQIALMFHTRLDAEHKEALNALDLAPLITAKLIKEADDISIILKSRGKSLRLGSEYCLDIFRLPMDSGQDSYLLSRIDEFVQPNYAMNLKMLEFINTSLDSTALPSRGDLLEMYCGAGNFTLGLHRRFNRVFASEVVRGAIATLRENIALNGAKNISFARLHAEELYDVINLVRDFERLRGINISSFNFTHALIDPPRSGVGDKRALAFLHNFEVLVYVSCNIATMLDDLGWLDFSVHSICLFDQFANTEHIECIGILTKNH